MGVVVGAMLAVSCGGSASGDGDGAVPTIASASSSETIGSTGTTSSTSAIATSTTSVASTTDTSVNEPETAEPAIQDSVFADFERPELEVQTEWVGELDEIYGRYLMYWEALYIALGPPFADPNYEPLIELLDPGVIEGVQEQLQGYRDSNAVVIRPESSLDDHGLRLPNPSDLSKTEGNRVIIQDCWIRDDVVRTIDGETSVEQFKTLLWNVDMIVLDGEWRYFSASEAGPDSDGYYECQAIFDTLER
jgi:hypothetical protein